MTTGSRWVNRRAHAKNHARFEIVHATGIESTFDAVNAWPYGVVVSYDASSVTAELMSLVDVEKEVEIE